MGSRGRGLPATVLNLTPRRAPPPPPMLSLLHFVFLYFCVFVLISWYPCVLASSSYCWLEQVGGVQLRAANAGK